MLSSFNGTPRSIARQSAVVLMNLTNNEATSIARDVSGASRGAVIVPTNSTITGLKFQASHEIDGVYYPVYNYAGAEIDVTVEAGKAYTLPEECFSFPFLKVLADVSQDDDTTNIVLCVKG